MIKKKILFAVLAWTLATASSGAQPSDPDAFTMTIVDVFSITGRGIVMTGRVEAGSLVVGDVVCIPLTSGEAVAREVTGIEMFRKLLERTEVGQNVGILVAEVDRKEVKKGERLHTDCEIEIIED